MTLNKTYWEDRYGSGQTGWDIGYPSPALTAYIDQLEDRNLNTLIPGAGNGYEVSYLWNKGFRNLTVVDIASQPLGRIRASIPEIQEHSLVNKDFFEFDGNTFDLILEQTFFCALDPAYRTAYVRKMHGLLRPGGKLAGLLFDFPLSESGPPFGGCEAEYRRAFEPNFRIKTLERANNSIPPRNGKELFFIFEKI